MNRKIKIFLAAYVNFPNAQNINCDNIARYLNKDKFEVHTLYTPKMPIDRTFYRKHGIRLHRLFHRRYLWFWSKVQIMLLADCDIYYLPKQEAPDRFFAKLVKGKKKLVSSVEGVVGEQIPTDDERTRTWFELMDEVFSISQCVKESVFRCWYMDTPLLYLGIDPPEMAGGSKQAVHEIIWVGSLISRKRPQYLLEIAKEFPELNFTMIGDGEMESAIRLEAANISNLKMAGRISNQQVYEHMKKADLLLMTSDKEGLPKVIGEAMSMGIPALYIDECYTVDYIQNGVNGYGVPDLDEMKHKIRLLIDDPERYKQMTKKARESIKPYLWFVLIKKYEQYFESLVKE